MKILFFTESGMGVSSLSTDQICELKRRNGDTYGVVSSYEQDEGLIRRMEDAGIELLHLDGMENHRHLGRHIGRLRGFIRNHGIEVVHAQTNWELLMVFLTKVSLLSCRRFRIFYTVHAFRNNRGWMKYLAVALMNVGLLVMADRVFCPSMYVMRHFGLVGYKAVLLPLGIDCRYFQSEWKFNEGVGISMVFPAQFRVGKRQDWIIGAFAEYIRRTGDGISRLIFPGDGPLRGEMMAYARSLGIEDRVVFPGACSKEAVYGWYDSVNIAMVASVSETFGQCIVEPFVMGKVVVSTPVGVAPEIIVDGVNGYLYDSVEELCGVMCRIAEDEGMVRRMGRMNFEWRERFEWGRITERYLKKAEPFK